MSGIVGVIPSRWGSTRFPGKSLALISGKPMIQWVVERVKQAKKLDAVIVATDDLRIAECVKALEIPDVQVAMTRADHPSGTDRIAEACLAGDDGAPGAVLATVMERLIAFTRHVPFPDDVTMLLVSRLGVGHGSC